MGIGIWGLGIGIEDVENWGLDLGLRMLRFGEGLGLGVEIWDLELRIWG